MLALLAVLWPAFHVWADGCFVAPPFVWDKHKDINEPTQKAILVYDAGREDVILQVKYGGPVEQFGWLVPVPSPPKNRFSSACGLPDAQPFPPGPRNAPCQPDTVKCSNNRCGSAWRSGVGIPIRENCAKSARKPKPGG
jgi:hypothetical protein